MTLRIVPIRFADACAFVAEHHRHHKPPRGMKFCLAVADDERTVGVAIVGRPVARMFDNGAQLEVVRTCTDGTPNANSALYGAAWRAAKAMGYRRLITYTQEGESGASLRAAGFRVAKNLTARPGWSVPSRPRAASTNDNIARTLWEITA